LAGGQHLALQGLGIDAGFGDHPGQRIRSATVSGWAPGAAPSDFVGHGDQLRQQSAIDHRLSVLSGRSRHGDATLDLAPGCARGEHLPQSGFHCTKVVRNAKIDVQEARIDAAQFQLEPAGVEFAGDRRVAGHALDRLGFAQGISPGWVTDRVIGPCRPRPPLHTGTVTGRWPLKPMHRCRMAWSWAAIGF
jgi:hypothetical protein